MQREKNMRENLMVWISAKLLCLLPALGIPLAQRIEKLVDGATDAYFERVEPTVLGNIKGLQRAFRQSVTAVAATLFAILSIPGLVVAQERAAHYHHYKFIDLGTLGGPHGYPSPNGPGSRMLNNAGVVAASADTTAEHPDAPDFCGTPECLVAHAFRWSHGVMTDRVQWMTGTLAPPYPSMIGDGLPAGLRLEHSTPPI